MKCAQVWCDGRGNAGDQGACAFYMLLEDGWEIEGSKRLPGEPSNNEAEYEGVIFAIERAAAEGVTHLRIFSDSQVIVNQIKGTYRVKEERLRPYRDSVWKSAENMAQVSIQHVPREENSRADKLCRDLFKPRKIVASRDRPGGLRSQETSPKVNPFL